MLAQGVFASLGNVSASAPELYSAIMGIVPAAIEAPAGEDPMAFWKKQVAQLQAQLQSKDDQVTRLSDDADQMATRLKKADNEIQRLRQQLQRALSSTAEAAEAAVMGMESGAASPVSPMAEVSSPGYEPYVEEEVSQVGFARSCCRLVLLLTLCLVLLLTAPNPISVRSRWSTASSRVQPIRAPS